MKTKQKIAVPILADREVFDYLKEKVGERKTKTEAFCDLLDKSLAGFVSPFLRNKGYELQPNQCHVTVSDLSSEWHWHRATVRSFLDVMEEFGLLNRIRLSKSVIITMTVQTSQSTESCNGQKKLNLAEQLREVLSDWIIGKVSLDETVSSVNNLFVGQWMKLAYAITAHLRTVSLASIWQRMMMNGLSRFVW